MRIPIFSPVAALAMLTLLTLLTLVGCASAPPPRPPAIVADGLPPCTATLPGADLSEWKEVQAEGFTFCLPRDWKADSQEWMRDRSRLWWNLGPLAPPAPRRVGIDMSSQSGRAWTRHVADSPPLDTLETIDGRPARLSRIGNPIDIATTATWDAPQIYFRGYAQDLATANLQLDVYRTVRFAPSSHP